MSIVQAQVQLPYDSAIPTDVAINTFHFIGSDPAPVAADLTNIAARLLDFYVGVHAPAVNALQTYLSPQVNPLAARLKMYDIGEPKPRAPIYDQPFGIVATGTTPAVSELCGVLSFQGAKISGVPQARRRGRIFFGPLTTTAFTSTAPVRLSANFIQSLVEAAVDLAAQGTGISPWAVYSRAGNNAVPVVDGWVDNAVDIQRRRGEAPTVRTLWT